MKALPLIVQKLWHMSNFQVWKYKVAVKVKTLGMNGKGYVYVHFEMLKPYL